MQATTEAVILLHSVRRLLMWNLIILPSIAVGLLVVMVVVSAA